LNKKSFRKDCLKKLRAKMKRNNRVADTKAMVRVDKIVRMRAPRSILFYLPMELEVDLRPLMNRYRKRYNIFVPFIVKESFKMVKYRLPLRRNRYNIFEPPLSHRKIKNVDMIIVPVVGVDGACKRVGFGKGMYDRYFQTLKNRPVVLFVQRQKCLTTEIVTDSYDITADFFVTPEETLYRGRKYDNRDSRGSGRGGGRCRRYSPVLKPHTQCEAEPLS
jgi:5-formyltetrahydrofolate cyclo-ligase